jgi:hypothetical protein
MEDAPDIAAGPQIMNVKVTNHNDFQITDMFDGVPYVFKTDEPIAIPIDAANHIFGWFPGVDQATLRRHVQRRMGWNTPEMEKSGKHNKFFAALEITPIIYRMVPVDLDPKTMMPPRPPKPNKLMQAVSESEARHASAE